MRSGPIGETGNDSDRIRNRLQATQYIVSKGHVPTERVGDRLYLEVWHGGAEVGTIGKDDALASRVSDGADPMTIIVDCGGVSLGIGDGLQIVAGWGWPVRLCEFLIRSNGLRLVCSPRETRGGQSSGLYLYQTGNARLRATGLQCRRCV